MKRILLGTFLLLSLAGMASTANADHCKKWHECFFEEQKFRGG